MSADDGRAAGKQGSGSVKRAEQQPQGSGTGGLLDVTIPVQRSKSKEELSSERSEVRNLRKTNEVVQEMKKQLLPGMYVGLSLSLSVCPGVHRSL